MIWGGGSAQPPGRGAHLARLSLEKSIHDLRMPDEKRFELLGRQHEAAQRSARHDVGGRRHSEEAGDLTEVVTRPQGGAVDPVDADARGAVEDDVEARPGEALTEHPVAF